MGYQPRDRRTAPRAHRAAPARARRRPRHAVKIAVALASLLVVSMTGYAWATLHGLVGGMTLADVVGSGKRGPQPADGAMDILLVGMDSRTDAQGNPLPEELLAKLNAGNAGGELNTDTLILLHIPNNGSKPTAVSLPRDSYVEIPGFGKHKINSAYVRAKQQAREQLKSQGVDDPAELARRSSHQGAKKLIGTVEQLVGFSIEHYASVNLLGFYSITKAVGGVKVCLKNPVDDPYSGAHFPAGVQTISGADALAFVRQRHGLPRGDLDRIQRQQAFMAGLARKILSAGTLADPGKLQSLVGAIKKSVVLDPGWNIFNFAQRMRGLTGGQVEFQTIPVANIHYRTPSGSLAVKVDPQRVHEFVESLDDRPTDKQPADKRVNRAAITVNVRNGNGTPNLAANVSSSLAGEGFDRGAIGNTTPRNSTVVRVAEGQLAAGKQVAATLSGGNVPVRESSAVAPGQVTVLLGDDFDSVSAPSAGSNPPAGSTGGSSAGSPSDTGASAQGKARKPIDSKGIPCVN